MHLAHLEVNYLSSCCSRVLGAYAGFLWEIEDDREEGDKGDSMNELENTNSKEETKKVSPSSHIAAANGIDMLDTAEAGSRRGDNAEENYKMMIEENPNNALLLRNYAQFLCQVRDAHFDLYFLYTSDFFLL